MGESEISGETDVLLSINPQLNSLAFGRLNIALGNVMKQFGNVDLGYLHVLCS